MSTEQIEKLEETIEIPEGVTIIQKKHMLQFQGPLGKTFKSFRSIPVDIQVNDGKVQLKAQGKRKRDY